MLARTGPARQGKVGASAARSPSASLARKVGIEARSSAVSPGIVNKTVCSGTATGFFVRRGLAVGVGRFGKLGIELIAQFLGQLIGWCQI